MTALHKTKTLSLRISAEDLDLITRAAKAAGKSVSAFVCEVSRRRAQDELIEQRFIRLKAADFDAFERELKQPAPLSEDVLNRFRKAKFAGAGNWQPAAA